MRLWSTFIVLLFALTLGVIPTQAQNPFEQAYDDLIDGYYTTLKDSDAVAISIKGEGVLYKGLIAINDEVFPIVLREKGDTLSGYYEITTNDSMILIGVAAKITDNNKMRFKDRVEIFTVPLEVSKEELDQKIAYLFNLEWKFWTNSYHMLQYDPPWEHPAWVSDDERLTVQLGKNGKGIIILNGKTYDITYIRKGMMIEGQLLDADQGFPFIMQIDTESRMKLVAGRYKKVVRQLR